MVNLFSSTGATKICRTLAVTHFLQTDPSLDECDQLIKSGLSVGATLRRSGFAISKATFTETTLLSGPTFYELTNREVTIGTRLRAQVYALNVYCNEQTLPYAIIAEAYHPDHNPVAHPKASMNALQRRTVEDVLSSLRATAQGTHLLLT